ncbi:hypothetical protein UFOVP602_32 [uncultured Caudovirales phage]|jgi:hypothetical protein|uniref:Uncharacterized protein n=1 Tax=uncultured Caudovirales phage TaxID=2100421 RepID=A0A6J5N4J3_9CAUD|nr:hypothetical protein UFOVP602_32 [uncultured Caudovirales phage]
MSERGSIVSEYIYCGACYAKINAVFASLNEGKYLQVGPIGTGIIGGNIGGMAHCDEIRTFEDELQPLIKEVICHDVRFAVLADNGEQIFFVKAKETE